MQRAPTHEHRAGAADERLQPATARVMPLSLAVTLVCTWLCCVAALSSAVASLWLLFASARRVASTAAWPARLARIARVAQCGEIRVSPCSTRGGCERHWTAPANSRRRCTEQQRTTNQMRRAQWSTAHEAREESEAELTLGIVEACAIVKEKRKNLRCARPREPKATATERARNRTSQPMIMQLQECTACSMSLRPRLDRTAIESVRSTGTVRTIVASSVAYLRGLSACHLVLS